MARWSTCQRSMNESPLFHSSAKRPLRRNRPSELPLPPAVAPFRRPRAPSRTASAPAADCTSLGLMISGSFTCRTSVGLQPESASVPASESAVADSSPRIRRRRSVGVIYRVIGEGILEAEGETDGIVAGGCECLELRRRVTRSRGAEGLRIHTGVLRPQHAEVARGQGGGQAVAADVARGPLLRRHEGEVQLAEADEIAVLDESRDR